MTVQGTVPVRARLDPDPGPPCRLARPGELLDHFAIRHQVFVVEQGLFDESDVDHRDQDPETLHALGFHRGEPIGAVRLYPLGGGLWQGDRLAVLSSYRQVGVGGPLVRLAVAEATARAGRRMVAHIQLPNVTFFRRLGWSVDGTTEVYCGREHQPMSIRLG